jgi:CheY-like chemotaxis protein
MKVDIAKDGLEGVLKFVDSKPFYYDAILMDIRMPNMKGLEAAVKIRSLDRIDAKSVIIIATSANAFEEVVKKSMKQN